MSAVILKLPTAANREAPTEGSPLGSASEWAREAMAHMVQRAIVSADDALFSMASAAASEGDRRRLFGEMRSLSKDAPKLVEAFRRALIWAPNSGGKEFDEFELRLQDDAEVEAEIIAGRVASRVEAEAKEALWDYGLRVQNITEQDGLRSSFEALLPPAICKAFRRMLDARRFEDSTRLVVFKVFERQFLGDAGDIYEGVSLRLEAAGIPSSASSRGGAGHDRGRAAPSYQLSPGVRGVLGGMGIGNRASQGERKLSAGGQQRVALMTQVLDEISKDWAPEESASLQGLIGPLLRIALGDPSFFSDPAHPARDVLGSLSRRSEPRSQLLERAALLLAALQINEEAKAEVEPLPPDLLREFLHRQRSAEAQVSARIEQARLVAHEQIKAAGSGSDLPAGVGRFLTQIWLPLASALHLKFGPDSAEMQRMTRMLGDVFHESRWLPKLSDLELSSDLLDNVGSELRSMSVPEPLVTKAKTLLKDGFEDEQNRRQLLDLETLSPREAAPASTPHVPTLPPGSEPTAAATVTPSAAPAVVQPAVVPPAIKIEGAAGTTLADAGLWRAAMPVGAWFRVYDRRSNQTRWLAAGVLYPNVDTLSFTGFDASTNMTVPRRQFLQDVHEGRAEAVEPTEDQGSALRLLTAAWQTCVKEAKAKGQSSSEASPETPQARRKDDDLRGG